MSEILHFDWLKPNAEMNSDRFSKMVDKEQFDSFPKPNPDEKWRLQLKDIFKTLRSLAIDNIEYFQTGKHSYHAKFHIAFCLLHEHIDLGIEPLTTDLVQRVAQFDLTPSVPGNGYRSLVKIIERCCLYLLQLCRHISVTRSSLLFRSTFYCKEIEAYVATLGQLKACLYYAQRLISFCEDGNLFAEEGNLSGPLAEQLLMEVELLKQNCFYGRCLGFQFVESMHRPLQVVAVAMASFSDGYHESSGVMQFATSLFNSGKYLVSPELRAARIVNITQTADIGFCKAFWSITETDIMRGLPAIVCPNVQVDEVISLQPEKFELFTGDMIAPVLISPASAHTGPAPFNVRLISYELREGQDPKSHRRLTRRKTHPPSPHLLIHCHGGGFVAQSSKSHEAYLKQWAKELSVPILSIDYSLAPENPFPRAAEECYYAYAWALNNLQRLGTTGEKICFAGDSAGGNLLISTTLRAIANGIPVPSGLMCAYTPTMIRYTPSPSRLLTMMDPLLPVGILTRCLAAYAGVSDSLTKSQKGNKSSSGTPTPTENSPPTEVRPPPERCALDHISLDTGFGSTDSIITPEQDFVLLDNPYGVRNANISDLGGASNVVTKDNTKNPGIKNHASIPNGNVHHSHETDSSHKNYFPDFAGFKENALDKLKAAHKIDDEKLKVTYKNDDSHAVEICKSETGKDEDKGNIKCDSQIMPNKVTSDIGNNATIKSETAVLIVDNTVPQTIANNEPKNEKNDVNNDVNSDVNLTSKPDDNHIQNKNASNSTINTKEKSLENPLNLTKNNNEIAKGHKISTNDNTRQFSLDLDKICGADDAPKSPVHLTIPRGQSADQIVRPMSRLGTMTDTLESPIFEENRPVTSSPRELFRHLAIVENPYMSPLLAPDDLLRHFPPTFLVGCHFDPILDDSVMFAKKLRRLGCKVHLHLIDGLTHGFLNFTLVSKDAKHASDICVAYIDNVFNPV